jgi:hypothetical protein
LLGEPSKGTVRKQVKRYQQCAAIRPEVQILPDGRIVYGLQHVRALAQMGELELDVIVRDDLAGFSDDAVEVQMIDHLLRSEAYDRITQTSLLARAQKLASRLRPAQRCGYDNGTLVEQLKRRFKCSLRSAERDARLSQTPIEVQQAYRKERLPIARVGKIAALSPQQQEEITEALCGGAKLRDILAAKFPDVKRHKSPDAAIRCFCADLERARADLEGREHQVSWITLEQAYLLRCAQAFIGRILATTQVFDPTRQLDLSTLLDLASSRRSGPIEAVQEARQTPC